MQLHMIGTCQDNQVFWPIIELILVDMVNNLVPRLQ